MNWDAIGAVGETVSAIAVVVSLIYVALQVRQNTRASRASTIQHWAAVSALEKQSLYESDELAKLIIAGGTEQSNLSPEDRLRYNTYMIQVFNTFEFLYLQYELGTVDKVFFDSKVPAYERFLQLPGVLEFWNSPASTFDPRFKAFVGELIESRGT